MRKHTHTHTHNLMRMRAENAAIAKLLRDSEMTAMCPLFIVHLLYASHFAHFVHSFIQFNCIEDKQLNRTENFVGILMVKREQSFFHKTDEVFFIHFKQYICTVYLQSDSGKTTAVQQEAKHALV